MEQRRFSDHLNKVGPHGYIHGWIRVNPGEASEDLDGRSDITGYTLDHKRISGTFRQSDGTVNGELVTHIATNADAPGLPDLPGIPPRNTDWQRGWLKTSSGEASKWDGRKNTVGMTPEPFNKRVYGTYRHSDRTINGERVTHISDAPDEPLTPPVIDNPDVMNPDPSRYSTRHLPGDYPEPPGFEAIQSSIAAAERAARERAERYRARQKSFYHPRHSDPVIDWLNDALGQ